METESMGGNSRTTGDLGEEPGIAASIGRLADGMGNLVAQHLQLARLEVSADVKALGGELARVAIFLPFVLVGYGLLCAAAAVALARMMALDAALALVGGANLTGGGLGLWAVARRLKQKRLMGGSLDELGSSAVLFGRAAPEAPRLEAPRGR
ncbi:MAG: phage holin family protein [Myxococcaceae bacterium]